jgi:SPP1 family predicted phage head-tail adaptor
VTYVRQAGRRDRQLTIKKPTITQDTWGGQVKTYATLDTVWAESINAGGKRFLEAAQHYPGLQKIFHIDYRTDFDENSVIEFEGKTYSIVRIQELGYRDSLEILVKNP